MSMDNFTQLQKIALEGEIAKAIGTSKHDAEILCRLYIILKKAPKELGSYVIEIVKDLTHISEELIDRTIAEVSSNEFPLWLWTDKVIADMKFSLRVSCSESVLSEGKMDKKEVQQKVILSAFIFYCRQVALISSVAVRELCLKILDDETGKLDFLKATCFTTLSDIKDLPEGIEIPDEILVSSIDLQNILSYKLETDIITKLDEESDTPLKDIVEKVLREKEQEESKQSKKPKENKVHYSVIKYYTECGVSTTLKTFKTEEEAEQFLELIKKQFPDIQKTCKLFIKET